MENLRHLHLPFFDANECKEVISYIDEKQIFLEKKYDQTFSEQKDSVLENLSTKLYQRYNFFHDNPKYIPRLKKILLKNFPELKYPLLVQCWGNCYKKNQGIRWHTHSLFKDIQGYGLTSNIFIDGDESIGITYALHDENIPRYKYVNVKNKKGYIQFVSNETFHMVSPNKSDQKRYTLGVTITEYNSRYSDRYFDSFFRKKGIEGLLVIEKPDKAKTIFDYA